MPSRHQQQQQQPQQPVYIFLIVFSVFAAIVALKMAGKPMTSTKASNSNLNVFKKPLGLFSKQPMTGFYRDGYCRTGPEDKGNHAVAGLLTDEFLDFSASRGNNLRDIGLTAGCKWCLCTNRWQEAMRAAKSADDPVVPKVFLHATDQSAISNGISMDDLQKFAAEGEAMEGGPPFGTRTAVPITPDKDGKRGIAKETH